MPSVHAPVILQRQLGLEVELERQWILVRDGDRAMAIVGAYLADRSERLRPLVRAALAAAEMTPCQPIFRWVPDPAPVAIPAP